MSKPFRLSLKVSLIGILVSVFILFFLGMLVLFAIKSPIGIRHTANRVIKEISRGVDSEVGNLFNPIDRHLQLTQSMVSSGYFSEHVMSDKFWEDYSYRVLKNLPSARMVYFVLPNKHFIISRRQADGTESTEVIVSASGQDNSTIMYRNGQGSVVRTEHKSTHFNVALRPWYQSTITAKKAVWSAPYVFETGHELGITRSIPIKIKKSTLIMGVDITLKDLSKFVASMSQNEQMIVMMLNRKGDLLAYPDMGKLVGGSAANKGVSFKQLKRVWVKDAFKKYQLSPQHLVEGESGGVEYIANFSSIPGFDHKNWLVGTVATVKGLVGNQKERLIESMFWVLGMMLVCVFVLWFFANRFSQRIMKLEGEMKRLSMMDFSHTLLPKSYIKEIDTIETALKTMRNGLTAFKKYVPDKLVRKLLDSKEGIKQGGTKQDLVVFFSDIVNFTEFSEVLQPKDLLNHLCDYFQLVTDLIWEYQGTIDKFIGDAVMAFWGAPAADEQKVYHACQAALKIQRALRNMADSWEAAGKPALPTRIGLHRGDVVVGNVGSTDRFNYTAVGDSVNLASRLESIARVYSAQIVVSEMIYESVRDVFLFSLLDVMTVKGKSKSVKIYELLGQKDENIGFNVDEYNTEFQTAFEHYQRGEFDVALTFFEEMITRYDRPVLELYVSRCRALLESPPLDWDGVWHYKSK
jgi:adenylate cyclase